MYKEATIAAVELLSRLIATPSVSREETTAADIIEQYLTGQGLQPQRHNNNVWVVSRHQRADRPTLLLNAHIDTVRPASGWQRDPFAPTLEDDRLYGLGSNDCGGGLMALMQTFLHYERQDADACAYNLVYLASAEEEVSGKNGIESALPLLPHIDFAVVGEPTGLQPAIAEKGLMVIDATAHGRSGHAAREEGDNALYHALDDIALIRRGVEDGTLFPLRSPMLGPVKATVTIIQSGTQHNVIPDRCTFTIDVRSNECYSNTELLQLLTERLQSDLKARSTRLSSSSIAPDHPFVRRCVAQGLQPFGSPTLSDQALMSFPSLKLGPGQSARSHTADEYICISEIEDAIRLYTELLSNNQ